MRILRPAYIPAMLRPLAALIALLWVGSVESTHAQQRGFPSLSRRPVESRDRDAEIAKAQATPVVVRPLDQAVAQELARLGTKAEAAGKAFDRDLPPSDRAVSAAQNAAPASESWVVAQKALSALDASRFDSVTALASMDSIYVQQLNDGGDATVVEGYRAPVAAMVDRQNDRLDSLRLRLRQP